MKKIAIVNNKGGCGKTTTVFNLAHYFAKRGLKTLTVDTDPQLNLSTNFGINVNELNFSLGDYLLERSNEFEPEILNENLHLISAGPEAEKDMEELKNQGPYYYQLLNNFLENLSEEKYNFKSEIRFSGKVIKVKASLFFQLCLPKKSAVPSVLALSITTI